MNNATNLLWEKVFDEVYEKIWMKFGSTMNKETYNKAKFDIHNKITNEVYNRVGVEVSRKVRQYVTNDLVERTGEVIL
jgi:hypothetical protein